MPPENSCGIVAKAPPWRPVCRPCPAVRSARRRARRPRRPRCSAKALGDLPADRSAPDRARSSAPGTSSRSRARARARSSGSGSRDQVAPSPHDASPLVCARAAAVAGWRAASGSCPSRLADDAQHLAGVDRRSDMPSTGSDVADAHGEIADLDRTGALIPPPQPGLRCRRRAD